MESDAYYRKGKVGLPTWVTLKLEQDIITIKTIESTILNTPVTTLTNVGQGMGFISFKVGDDYYSLEFLRPVQKFFGLIGIMLARKERATAKEWRKVLEAKGIQVRNQMF